LSFVNLCHFTMNSCYFAIKLCCGGSAGINLCGFVLNSCCFVINSCLFLLLNYVVVGSARANLWCGCLKEQSDFLVVGVLGLQGAGKSRLLSK
jgi:hypothetical protein